MSKLINLFLTLSLLLFSLAAKSGEIYDATVKGILVTSSGFTAIQTEGGTTVTNQPGCATGSYPWAFSTGVPEGSAILSLLLTAKTTQAKVHIIGTADCSVSNNKEAIKNVFLNDGPN